MDADSLKIYRGIIDNRTLMTLYSFINKGLIDQVIGIVKEGKESGVFLAKDKKQNSIAIKIYRTLASDFKTMWRYLIGDKRFSSIRKNRASVIFSWCSREYKNLKTCYEAGVSCPSPIYAKNNVLLMSFVGDEHPAPRLIDVSAKKKDYEFILKQIELMFKAGIVHGDLSAYNILLYKKPVIIDFSHGISVKSLSAPDMLKKDIQNINSYFSKLGIKTKDERKIYERLVRFYD
ncbi:MAG: serine protein kinase RIO [Candidatus Aenigmatarchaeota archaeon]